MNKTNKDRKKKKIVIDKYIQPIYIPNNLYIVKDYTTKELDKYFYKIVEDKKVPIIEDNDDSFDARAVFGVYHKDDPDHYANIVILRSDYLNKQTLQYRLEVCGHEALHIAQYILENCDIVLTPSTTEAYAYLVGWITGCIYNTLTKK